MRHFTATISIDRHKKFDLEDSKTHLFEELDREAFVHLTPHDRLHGFRERRLKATFGISIPNPEANFDVEQNLVKSLTILGSERQQYEIESIEPCTAREALIGKDFFTLDRHKQSQITHMLDCPELMALFRYPDFFHEERVITADFATVCAGLEHDPFSEYLVPQLEKIYESQGDTHTREAGVPVHFKIRQRPGLDHRDAVRALCTSLYSSGRVATPNVYFFDFRYFQRTFSPRGPTPDRAADISRNLNRSLVRSLLGGTVVVRYGDDDADSSFEYSTYEGAIALLDALYAEIKLQLILVIPAGKPDLEQRLARAYPQAIISIDTPTSPVASVDPEAMVQWLAERAESVGLTPDEDLFELARESASNPLAPNAESLFETWRQKKLLRETYPQYQEIPLSSDISITTVNNGSAKERLNSLIGLHDVKEVIYNTLREHRMREQYYQRGIELPARSLHAIFAGAPGTGKTEVASLYGEILREEGVLKEGRLFTISGGREINFAELFKKAKGSVIFIDEAYGLLNKPSVTELIAQMENNRADTVVILAGYADQMDALLKSNPGFASRIGVHVSFPDYTTVELLEIFNLMVKDAGLQLDRQAERAAHDILNRRGRPDDQGNARFVRNIFENTLGNLLARIDKEYPDPAHCPDEKLNTILPTDLPGFEDTTRPEPGAGRKKLDSLIGLDEVKNQVEKITALAKVQKTRRDQGITTAPISLNMSFEGNPGTGKTEVARLVARILHEEGILAVGDLIECARQDLVGKFVGQTAPKVHDKFRRARGSVLFIDEAYTLVDSGNGGFGQEAIDTLIKDMEEYRDEVVVIFAGYPRELNRLFRTNPGFPSRVSHHIEFPDYTADELVEILQLMASRYQLTLAVGVAEKVETLTEQARDSDTFGNARFIRQLFEKALENQALRLTADDDPQLLLPEDFHALERSVAEPPFGFH